MRFVPELVITLVIVFVTVGDNGLVAVQEEARRPTA
jgi:hypothetical protein